MLAHGIRYAVTHRVQIAKFAFVGILTFCIYFLSFHLLYGWARLDYRMAVSLAYVIGVVSHFLLNRFFTFEAGGEAVLHHTWRYLLLLALNYGISLGVVWISVEIGRLSPYIGVVASTGVTASVSFLGMKHFVFD